jgi:soluble lytic murein transglycosylase-like protein
VRRRWIVIVVVVLVLAGVFAAYFFRGATFSHRAEKEEDARKPEAPPDLEKLRERYAAGTTALAEGDGEAAVEKLASFSFGSRAVEEYRLYYLANGHQLMGDAASARSTLARLWHRKPRLAYADDAAFHLGRLYTEQSDWSHAADVFVSLAQRSTNPAVIAAARWSAVESRLASGDVASALFSARNIVIHEPKSQQARDAEDLVRALTGLSPDTAIPMTPGERLDRAEALRISGDPDHALEELTKLSSEAPHIRSEIELQRGLAIHQLRRFEESNRILEPLTSGAFKVAIPALRHTARNYAILATSIDPYTYKKVKERKRVGTVKVRVGKGKKRHTVTRPKYQTVFKEVKLVDLAKKAKKEEYERLASERLKDLLSLPIDDDVQLETLNTLIARAEAKNQDEYLRELVPKVLKVDRDADPALQHFWDNGWAAYQRGDLATAHALFSFIAETYTHPNVRRQAAYWDARTIERQGKKEEAKSVYARLAAAPYTDLYAIHAIGRGAKPAAPPGSPLEKKGPDWREIAEKQMPPELQLAYELTALGSMRDASIEISRNSARGNVRFAQALMADVHQSTGNVVAMYQSMRKAWPQLATVEQDEVPAYFLSMYYPRRYSDIIEEQAGKNGVDPNVIHALILQESYYNPKAKSRVGATGLMQLMPPTAQDHARRLHLGYSAARLTEPEYNIALGTFHFRMLMGLFRGNTYLAIASYNAGQGNVMKWQRGAPKKPLDELLESIPFPETRNYVKRVTILRSTYARIGG